MTADQCEHWHGLVALEALGLLQGDERTALLSHLDGCGACRDDLGDLAPLRGALDVADPGAVAPLGMPHHLEEAVVGRLRSDADAEHRRGRLMRGLSAAAAAVAVVAAVLLGTTPWSSAPQQVNVALAGAAGVHANAVLLAQKWGTEVDFHESGQAGGQVFTVSLVGTTGKWWSAGTYETVAGQDVRVELACALRPTQVTAIYVRDSGGHIVLAADHI